MAFSLAKFIEATNSDINDLHIRPRVFCQDGFSISIQAGIGHHSTPNDKNNYTYYSCLELGYPSEDDSLAELAQYKDVGDVYSYVDWMVVEKLLDKHGGIFAYSLQ